MRSLLVLDGDLKLYYYYSYPSYQLITFTNFESRAIPEASVDFMFLGRTELEQGRQN